MPSNADYRKLIKQLQREIVLLRDRAETARQRAIQTRNWERHHHYNKEISKRNNILSELRLKILTSDFKEAHTLSDYYKKTNPTKHAFWKSRVTFLKKQLATIKTIVEKQVKTINENAAIAHENMQSALSNRDHQKAIEFREDRDRFNSGAARLMKFLVLTIKVALDGTKAPVKTPVKTFPSNKIAKGFEKNHNQDIAHRAIFKELLEGKYAKKNIGNDSNIEAFKAIRKNILAPLYYINTNIHLHHRYSKGIPTNKNDKERFLSPKLKIEEKVKPSSYFIRDFMGIRSRGGLVIKNWLIEDTVIDSDFASDFDDLVVDVNAHISKGSVSKFKDIAHRDVMQLIPAPNATGSDQMAGAMMSNIEIVENIMLSKGQLNCIFGSDGAFKDLVINKNHIQTKGEHVISINGMLSGSIKGNTDIQGKPLKASKIKLLPLRIGGGANIYIIGFKNKPGTPEEERYEYKAIKGVPVNDCANSNIINARDQYGDMRRCIEGSYAALTPGASFYDEVDMQEFHKEYARHPNIIKTGRKKKSYLAVMKALVKNGYAIEVKSGVVSNTRTQRSGTG